jgi:hypothetical protein
MDTLSYRQISYLYRKTECFREESYWACNISDTCAEIPTTNILHAPHSAFSGLRLTDLNLLFVCLFVAQQHQWASTFTRFLDHTQRRPIVGRTPLDEWSARFRDLYLRTHKRQTSMPPVGFEPTISAGERPQTSILDRAATGTCDLNLLLTHI